MAKFTDAKGLNWDIRIDLGTMWDYKETTGVDVFALAAAGKVPIMDMLGLAYVSVRKPAVKFGFKTCQEWLRGIGKDSTMPATEAANAEIAEFYPDVPDDEDTEGADPPTPAPGAGEK